VPAGATKKFIVRSFRLENAKATVGVGAAAITVPLPPLTLTDLGAAQGGITADQLATAVLKQVLAQIGVAAGEAALKAGSQMLDGGKSGGEAAGEAAKSTLNKLLGK
jgi:hypothetical protein